MQEIKDTIRSYLVVQSREWSDDSSNDPIINDDTNIVTRGYIDSFGLVGFVFFLEKTFNVEIPDDLLRVEHFDTIGKLANLIIKLKTNTQ